MINLLTLVERANTRYGLDLTAAAERDVVRKLRTRGVGSQIEKAAANDVIDLIFDVLNHQQSESSKKVESAYRLSGGPKLVVEAASNGPCPRCKGPMCGAQLHTRETVRYCKKCKIALTQG